MEGEELGWWFEKANSGEGSSRKSVSVPRLGYFWIRWKAAQKEFPFLLAGWALDDDEESERARGLALPLDTSVGRIYLHECYKYRTCNVEEVMLNR